MNRTSQFSSSKKEIEHCIETDEFYRQSCGGNPTFITLPFDGVVSTFEPGMLFVTFHKEVVDIYIRTRGMIARAERTLENEKQGRPVIHQEYMQWCHERDAHYQYTATLDVDILQHSSIQGVIK